MLTKFRLANIGPFSHWEADQLTTRMLVTGDNGEGKSTIRNVFTCMLDDHNSHLIREGETEGEVYMEFLVSYDPTTGEINPNGAETGIVKSTQRVRFGGSSYDIVLPNGLRVLKSQKAFLKGLVSGCSLDPLKFVNGTNAERLQFLLAVSPILFSKAELQSIVGGDLKLPDILDLDTFESLLASIEKERTEQNAKRDATKGLLSSLENALPPAQQDGTDWTARVRDVRALLDARRAELRTVVASIDGQYREAVDQVKEITRNDIYALGEKEELEIAAIREKYGKLRGDRRRQQDADLEAIDMLVCRERDDRIPPIEAIISTLTSDLATAEANALQHQRDTIQRENVEAARSRLRAETLEATRRQKAVEALRALRTAKLSDIGVDGVGIKEGVIYVDGKRYDTQLNEAERIKVAIQIAAKALQDVPVRTMIVDAGDVLSNRNLDWLMQGAEDADIQVFVTKRVEGQGLQVVNYEDWRKQAA